MVDVATVEDCIKLVRKLDIEPLIKELEDRIEKLEEAMSVKSKKKTCAVCGFSKARPWVCEVSGCPRMGVMDR